MIREHTPCVILLRASDCRSCMRNCKLSPYRLAQQSYIHIHSYTVQIARDYLLCAYIYYVLSYGKFTMENLTNYIMRINPVLIVLCISNILSKFWRKKSVNFSELRWINSVWSFVSFYQRFFLHWLWFINQKENDNVYRYVLIYNIFHVHNMRM